MTHLCKEKKTGLYRGGAHMVQSDSARHFLQYLNGHPSIKAQPHGIISIIADDTYRNLACSLGDRLKEISAGKPGLSFEVHQFSGVAIEELTATLDRAAVFVLLYESFGRKTLDPAGAP